MAPPVISAAHTGAVVAERAVSRPRIEDEDADRGRVGGQPVLGSDPGAPSGEVDVPLGHPLDGVQTAMHDEPMQRPLVVPVITGATVTLRPFEARDVEAVLDAATDPLIPLITTVPDTADSELAAAFVMRQHERAATGAGYSFAVESGAVCVGQIGLWLRDVDQGRATIGYWIRPASRRRGHAVQALRVLTHWAWSLPDVHRLQLYIEPDNTGSCRTAERAGYAREGLLRSWEVVGQERRDMFMYGLTRP